MGSFAVKFDRPFFPQWKNGIEISNAGFGYRLSGVPADLVLTGSELNSYEEIRVENRIGLGRVVSSGSLKAGKGGKFYLRIKTKLPKEFIARNTYDIYFIRADGSEHKAGSFYIAELPPSYYYYLNAGNMLYGFACDLAGTPCLLSWMSYRNSPNILDNYRNDRGRDFQGDVIAGYPWTSDNFRFDTVNPTQGGGAYGRILPVIENSVVKKRYIKAEQSPLDYMPWADNFGPYRRKLIENRWPHSGYRWPHSGYRLISEYKLTANQVHLRNKFWHTDTFPHHVHQLRSTGVYLNPIFFQTLLNENKREYGSWLHSLVKDNKIETYSHALGLKIIFKAGADNLPSHFCQRHWRYGADSNELAVPGEAEVWEALNVTTLNKMIYKNQPLSGWGVLTVQDTKAFPLSFDFSAFINSLKAIFKRRTKMQIVCNFDEEMTVTNQQFEWLKAEGALIDMSNFPQADTSKGHYNGTKTALNALLEEMPDNWAPAVPVPPVTPPSDDTLDSLIGELEEVARMLNGVINGLKNI